MLRFWSTWACERAAKACPGMVYRGISEVLECTDSSVVCFLELGGDPNKLGVVLQFSELSLYAPLSRMLPVLQFTAPFFKASNLGHRSIICNASWTCKGSEETSRVTFPFL